MVEHESIFGKSRRREDANGSVDQVSGFKRSEDSKSKTDQIVMAYLLFIDLNILIQ